jgi:hypothetical protein
LSSWAWGNASVLHPPQNPDILEDTVLAYTQMLLFVQLDFVSGRAELKSPVSGGAILSSGALQVSNTCLSPQWTWASLGLQSCSPLDFFPYTVHRHVFWHCLCLSGFVFVFLFYH